MDAITSASEAEEARGLPRPASTGFSSIELFLSSPKTYLFTEVDPNAATVPLAAYCFMTGYTISFSTVFIWCGFPTGNSLRLALALARLFQGPGHPDPFQFADQEALVSIFAFAVGASLGRIGDRMGARTRAWLALGTFIQALFTMAATIALWKSGKAGVVETRGGRAWAFACLGLMSASLGLQGIVGKRVNTQFATTIVLTTVWSELVVDPMLFDLRRTVISRDHRLVAILVLFLGGFVSRVVMQAIGQPAALGIGTGMRVLIALAWLFVPAKKAGKK